jgi:putative DNA methylase
MEYKKKLIEVALPLEVINEASAREKSIRHGHPSTLHLWWARRPLAAARAVIWSSLVDDPSSLPEQFPTEEAQTKERQRLFGILERLVKWENSNNQEVLAEAKAEIMKSTNGSPPPLLDPFAGGGSIPLEAQRLGLEAHASDLNPVAVMINKAMIEIPPTVAGCPPVNPDARSRIAHEDEWEGAHGLAEDVRYYGEWMKKKAFEKIGHLYPKVKDEHGREHTVIAWIWARTVKCPNPACGCEMPLASSFVLSKKKGKEAWVEPTTEGKKIRFIVHIGKCPTEKQSYKISRGAVFKCPVCGETTMDAYVKQNGKNNKLGVQLMAIVSEGINGRIYLPPNNEHVLVAQVVKPDVYPSGAMPDNPRWFSPPAFGMTDFSDLFTPRQLTVLTTFSDLVHEAQKKAEADAVVAGMGNDPTPLADGGMGAGAYGQAVGVYLGFAVDREANYCSSNNTWGGDFIVQVFGRQAIPMVWDFAESNPFSSSTGNWSGAIEWIVLSINNFPIDGDVNSVALQNDAQSDNGLRHIMVSTDPPYYDNIGYADLSDYFYIWLRRSLRKSYPELFRTMLVPKTEELIATPYRFDGNMKKARDFFENGMIQTFTKVNVYALENIPVTVYYAYKQKETDDNESEASTGWETMLSAMVQAGFAITGTWPMRTERSGGFRNNPHSAVDFCSFLFIELSSRHIKNFL